MSDQLKIIVGSSGAILGLVVGISVGLLINSDGGGAPSQPVVTSNLGSTSTPPISSTTEAPIAVAP